MKLLHRILAVFKINKQLRHENHVLRDKLEKAIRRLHNQKLQIAAMEKEKASGVWFGTIMERFKAAKAAGATSYEEGNVRILAENK